MKLFASDFDGTFFFGVSEPTFISNINASKEFQKENKFAFVTGRSPKSILYNLKNEDFVPDYIAGFNGGIIVDSKMNVLYQDCPQVDVNKIMEILKNEKIHHFSFISEKYMFVKYYRFNLSDRIFMHHFSKQMGLKVKKKLSDDLKPIYMLTVVCKDSEQAKRISQNINNLNMDCSTFVNKHCVDITGKKASKANAVEIISKHMNADEIYVIGDSYNDLSMIEKYHGFTLNHANEEIKNKACKVFKNVKDAIESVMLHK